MAFRKWVFVFLALTLLIGVCCAGLSKCGWTDQQVVDCSNICRAKYSGSELTLCVQNCLNKCQYPGSPQTSVITTKPTTIRTTITTIPITTRTTTTTIPATTESPVDCQAMYSSCIQSNCPGTQGTKTCYDSCQYRVEAQSGASCVLFPGKIVTTGIGNAGGVSGDVAVNLPTGQGNVPLKNGDAIPLGSTVTTKEGKVTITFQDGSQINVGPNSQYTYDNQGYRLQTGEMRNFATCSIENLAPGSFACPPIFSPVARFSVRGGTQ